MIRTAAIVSTGDELTTGRTTDTNATFLADQLVAAGFEVVSIIVVGDYPERIEWAWRQALRHADVVLSTGGLGPTADDLTTETVARMTARPLSLDEDTAALLRQRFAALGRPMPENNLKQAHFPAGAVIIPNAQGTAPGFRLDVETEQGARHLIVLPGVPREMRQMVEDSVLPWLAQVRGGEEVYLSHVFQTFGISESALDEVIAGCVAPEDGRVAFRAAFPQISVRLTVHGLPAVAQQRLATLAARLRERMATYAYGEGETTMEAVVGARLKARGLTLAVAESCTGGLIGHRLTAVPGSSAYFKGGIIAYANEVKERQLGVTGETLRLHGAVSEEAAVEMAAGVRQALGADIGLAVTGIAGPEGGTAAKPVGTVCIGLAAAETRRAHRYQLWGARDWVNLLASQIALDWVRRHLLGLDPTAAGFRR